MPRPRRAQGRPGTVVIPADWGSSHAPVATKAMRGTCQLLSPGEGPLVFDKTEGVSKRGDVEPSYAGPCRIQRLNAQDRNAVVGDQSQTTVGYLVTLSLGVPGETDGTRAADTATLAHRVLITACPDGPALVGERLSITSIGKGTERFEVDLFCVEDQSEPSK